MTFDNICTRINRPARECQEHNLHCGAPACFALAPGAIEDAGGGEVKSANGETAAPTDWCPICNRGNGVHAPNCQLGPRTPTPTPDTKWDRDARAALTSLGTWMPAGYGNLNSDEALAARAKWAGRQADALAAERARRGEVG